MRAWFQGQSVHPMLNGNGLPLVAASTWARLHRRHLPTASKVLFDFRPTSTDFGQELLHVPEIGPSTELSNLVPSHCNKTSTLWLHHFVTRTDKPRFSSHNTLVQHWTMPWRNGAKDEWNKDTYIDSWLSVVYSRTHCGISKTLLGDFKH